MATNLNISENQERVPLTVGSRSVLRSITPDNGSPYYVGARAYVTQTASGAIVTVIDKEGTTTATILNGTNGTNGQDGNGIASIDLTSTVGNVDTYTITYTDGTTDTFEITNGIDGQDGQDGADGQDGFSPSATASKVGDTATITITDKDGTTTATISDGVDGTDGVDGQDGADGFSPIATVTKSGDTATISITDANGTTTTTITDGEDGQDGSIVSVDRKTSSGTNIADITIDGVTTQLYAPNGGGGTITDVEVDGTSVVTGGVAEIDLTGKSDVGHTHTTSAITDFPTLATVATSGDYDDLTDKPTIPSNVSDLVNDSGFITSPNVVYCTCTTASGTAAKVATIESGSLTSLNEGDQAIVKFTNANGVANPTLKIGSTTAKSIKRYGTTAPSTSANSSWNAGSAVMFIYDGTYWQIVGYLNTTYSEISETNITNGSNTSTGLITGRRAKKAVEAFAPVQSVNGSTGAVTIAVPTKTSDLTNDSGFITGYTETDPIFTASAAHGISSSDIDNWDAKQDELVSGVSIRTINGTSVLGSGDIEVAAGGTPIPTADTVAEFDSDAHINSEDMSSQDVSDFVANISGGADFIKQGTFTGTTSPAGTLPITGISDFHTIVGLLNSSVMGTSYCVQYDGSTYGFFNYAPPHNPLASTSVTIVFLYI